MTRRDHLGRLIDHLHLVVRDIEASRRFYRAALGALGLELSYEAAECFACDELFVSSAGEVGVHSTAPHRVHLAFQAPDRESVARFTRPHSRPGGATTAASASAPITAATSPRSCSIQTGTTSRPCTTGAACAPLHRW